MLLGVGPAGPIRGRRVAITGIGALTCAGVGADALWKQLIAPTVSGERSIPGFDPANYFEPKEARRIDRFAQLSVASAEEALLDAKGLDPDPARSGVIFATGVGGFDTLVEQINVFSEKGARRVSPFMVPMMMANAGAAHIAMRAGWHGPCETVVTACAAGTHAIAAGARLVASGRCDVVISGGAEAALNPVAVAAFSNMTALSSSGNSRPFDLRRDGFVMAEGGAAVILEDYDRAIARGAHIYAEILGTGSSADAHHITAPAPEGLGAVMAMRAALEDAQVTPDQITQINAHGTSTPLNDLAESRAIAQVFDTPPPVTSTKGLTGHGLGAAGAIEVVASALSIENKLIPHTYGTEQIDPEIHLDVVMNEPRPWTPGIILSNSFGFGGHNGCLVIGAPTH